MTDIDLDTTTLSGDLRTALLDHFRANTMTWNMMSEPQRAAFAYEIDSMCKHLVREAVRLIAADGHRTIEAKCGEVKRRKDGDIEAKISIKGTDEQRHDLFDATGDRIILIVASAEHYIGERNRQRDLLDDAARTEKAPRGQPRGGVGITKKWMRQ